MEYYGSNQLYVHESPWLGLTTWDVASLARAHDVGSCNDEPWALVISSRLKVQAPDGRTPSEDRQV